MTSDQPVKKKPDRWSGQFKFSTSAIFDLSKVVSTRSCKGNLLFTVLDQVSDLKKELQVVDFDTFIDGEEEMALFRDPESKKYYQTIYNSAFRPSLFSVFQDVRKAITQLDTMAEEDPKSKDDYLSLLEKV